MGRDLERGVAEVEVVGPSPFIFAAQDRSRYRSRPVARFVERRGEHDPVDTPVEEVCRGRECPERVDDDDRPRHAGGAGEQ